MIDQYIAIALVTAAAILVVHSLFVQSISWSKILFFYLALFFTFLNVTVAKVFAFASAIVPNPGSFEVLLSMFMVALYLIVIIASTLVIIFIVLPGIAVWQTLLHLAVFFGYTASVQLSWIGPGQMRALTIGFLLLAIIQCGVCAKIRFENVRQV